MDSSILAKLPAELRNQIWENALYSSNVDIVSPDAMSAEPALLQTCRQIRNEAKTMYYELNTFRIRLPAIVKHQNWQDTISKFDDSVKKVVAKFKKLPQAQLKQMLPVTVICPAPPPNCELQPWQFVDYQSFALSQQFAQKGLKVRDEVKDVNWVLEWPEGSTDTSHGDTIEECELDWQKPVEGTLKWFTSAQFDPPR